MRGTLTFVAVVLLGLGAWFAFSGDSEPSLDAASSEVGVDPAPSESERANLSAPGAEARRDNSEFAQSSTAIEVVAPALVTVTGTIVLVGADESRFETESGSLTVVHSSAEFGVLEVAVEAGRFAFATELGASFEIRDVELSGVPCSLGEPAYEIEARENMQLALEAYRRVPASLLVRDRETGLDLAGIEVRNLPGWVHGRNSSFLSSPEAPVALKNAVSPLQLPEREGKQSWWIRAEGYAWARVDFDHRYGGELIALLDRAAGLTVKLEGRAPGQLYRVRISDQVDVFSWPSEHNIPPEALAELNFTGLRPGTVGITVDLGEFAPSDAETKERYVELKANEISVVSVECPIEAAPEPEPEWVDVSGLLILQAGRVLRPSSLRWTLLEGKKERSIVDVKSPSELARATDDLYSWETRLSPGRWRVEVRPFGHVQEFVIGSEGATGIELIVGELAEVMLKVKAASSGEPITDAWVLWSSRGANGSSVEGDATETSEPGTYRIWTPPGSISVSVVGRVNRIDARAERTFDVQPGLQEVTLELVQSPIVVVSFADGKAVVRPDPAWLDELRVDDADGKRLGMTTYVDETAEVKLQLRQPGFYRFSFGELDGYEPIEPIELQVVGGRNALRVSLIRTP